MITSTRICPHVFSNAFHHLTITPFISAILQKPSLASLEASSSSTGSVVPSSACFDCWVFTEQLGVRLQGALDCTDSISFWKYVPCVYLCSCTSCIQSFLGLAVSMLFGYLFLKKTYTYRQMVSQ